ncbi:10377_t:CDS:2 [Dentiscutata erythropus]|uniref:10377_t:CDS:1 n=1 Tax=Dentiscutata erythropus TaxID=1348616 RepID=A0A9N9FY54_9GLOM|nr:10377_t:CDS:2 [Dentiscutata erythropus]
MEYFDRKSSKWNILDFLNASTDIEPFDLKIDFYIKTLERIFDHEQGSRKQRARALLDDYRKGSGLLGCLMFKVTGWPGTGPIGAQGAYWDGATSDRELAKNWEMARRNGPSVNILNSTVLGSGTIYGGTTNGGISNIDISKKRHLEKDVRKDLAKRTKINSNMDGKIDEFFSPVSQRDQDHENIKNNHVNEESTVTLEPFVSGEELEENLLQENPGATVDFKLIIDNICIRSEMEKWRQTSKYIEEIHKQDLLRYNIIDTISSSGTKARGLFKHQWNNIINNIEKILVSPDTTLLSSDFDSVSDSANQDMEQDGRADDINQY